MPEIDNPHDTFFKATFGRPEVAADLLAHYLPPDVAAALDLSTLEPMKDSFVDPELQEHFSDLLYRVGLKDGGAAYACLLFEHKSTPEAMVAFQLLRYKVQTWEGLIARGAKKLPPLIPIVIYHGRRRWRIARNFGALIDWKGAEALRKYVDEFEYHLLDFSASGKTRIVGAAFAQAGLLVLRHAFTGELIERLPEIVRLLPTRERGALDALRYARGFPHLSRAWPRTWRNRTAAPCVAALRGRRPTPGSTRCRARESGAPQDRCRARR